MNSTLGFVVPLAMFLTSLIAWMLENHHTAFMGVLPKLWKLSLNASSAGGLTLDAFRNISQGSMTHWCSNSGDDSNVWFCKSWLHFSKVLKSSSISAIIDCSTGAMHWSGKEQICRQTYCHPCDFDSYPTSLEIKVLYQNLSEDHSYLIATPSWLSRRAT